MRIDGVQMRPSDHLTWRYGDPSRDKNLKGEPIGSDKKVIVRKKKCRTYTEHGQEKVDPAPAPAIPQRHVSRNKAFGNWRKQDNDQTKWIDGNEYRIYWTAPYYVVMGNTVYQGPVYSDVDPYKKAREKAARISEARRRAQEKDSILTDEEEAPESAHVMELEE